MAWLRPVTQSEFSIIDHFFKQGSVKRDDVALGIGDDGAVTNIASGMQLVSAVDTLVSKIHFPGEARPYDIGYKSLAVNLSDLAAMGAEPAWATLAITMPEADENWLQQFCDGFFNLAKEVHVQLIGGDTTQGPLTVTVQVMGVIPEGKALTRGGAKKGDCIFVSGTLGDAALGLAIYQQEQIGAEIAEGQKTILLNKLNLPTPRLALGIALRDIATAAIDVSDGLAADLNHILQASHLGATIDWQQIPLSPGMRAIKNIKRQYDFALGGGDDYELCFTAPADQRHEVQRLAQQLSIMVTEIGAIEETSGLRLLDKGVTSELANIGYQHFSKR